MFDQFELFVRSRPNCEFLKNNLHGQPVNLITNLAFFICGWKVYKLLRKHKINKKRVLVVILRNHDNRAGQFYPPLSL